MESICNYESEYNESDYEYNCESDNNDDHYNNNDILLENPGIELNSYNFNSDISILIYLETFLDTTLDKLNKLEFLYPTINIVHDNKNIISFYYTDLGKLSNNIGILKIYSNIINDNLKNTYTTSGISTNTNKTKYILEKFRYIYENITKRCIICWSDNIKDKLSMSTCNSELCKFSSQINKIGLNLDIIQNKDIIEMLITLFNIAIKSISKDDDINFLLHLPESITYESVKDIDIPSIETIKYNRTDDVIMRVIDWLIFSNNTMMIKVNKFKEFNDYKQYLIYPDDTVHENKFQELKNIYGSFYLFHGSNIKNWHAILRTGIKIFSGTSRMVNGAAYGNGIYASNQFSMSNGYSTQNNNSNYSLVAICEVINNTDKYKKNGNIYVIKDENYIVIRYLLLQNRKEINSKKIPNIDIHNLNIEDIKLTSQSDRKENEQYKNSLLENIESVYKSMNGEETCPICLCELEDDNVYKLTNCKNHYYHYNCLVMTLENKPKCVVCGEIYGKIIGDQPSGTMKCNIIHNKLSGYNCDTIQINYNIPRGINYSGTSRTAYLPNNQEGNYVLNLLKQAFEQKLIFTVGTSLTSGAKNAITWNGIHHKTSMSGGAISHGYPDVTYLERVRDELKQFGIK